MFRVSSLQRTKSGAFKARKAIPADVRDEYQALYGQRWEAIFTAPASAPTHRVKALHIAWLAEVERRVAALRAGRDNDGQVELTQREADTLAADWYREFTAQHLDNPGTPERWERLADVLRELLEDDPDDAYRRLAVEAGTGRFLADRGIALTGAAWTLFHAAVAHEFLEAASTLERRAGGDWSPDKHEAELAPSQPLAALRMTATGLFEQYIADKKTKPSTIARWRCVFDALDHEQWQGLSWNAQRWADGLIGPDRGAKGVRDTWIAAPRAVWKWAMRKRLVSSNPFTGVTVDVPRRVQVREAGKTFADAEARTILRAALQTQYSPEVPLAAAKRWAAWLCAYTGARVGEITQLRACDIEQRACGPVLRITPEAGTVKTDRARTVPIHEHLVEQGLLDYVEAVRASRGASAPLFCHAPKPNAKGRGPALQTREKLAAWVRSLAPRCPSLADRGIQPNHAWRHTFKSRAMRVGIEPGIRDAICGHAPRNAAQAYEHITVEDMAAALKHFPRYEVAQDQEEH